MIPSYQLYALAAIATIGAAVILQGRFLGPAFAGLILLIVQQELASRRHAQLSEQKR